MSYQIITVSREFGSGGRTIGKMTAEKLGIPCYDQELIEQIAKESGFAKEYIAEQGEYTPSANWFANALAEGDGNGHSTRDILWQVQRKVILELAAKGPCVIVGRCADYILKEKFDCLTVFIHAPLEKRAERIVRVYGENGTKPEKRLKDKDKRRQAYYQLYTDMDWGVAKNYMLSLDSGAFGLAACVAVIAQLYRGTGI